MSSDQRREKCGLSPPTGDDTVAPTRTDGSQRTSLGVEEENPNGTGPPGSLHKSVLCEDSKMEEGSGVMAETSYG